MAATPALPTVTRVLDAPPALPRELPDKAKKAIARVSDLVSAGYLDVAQRSGGRLDRCAGAFVYAVGRIVNSKNIPAAHEQAVAERVLFDLLLRAGVALADELRRDASELIADIIDQLRNGGTSFKPRG